MILYRKIIHPYMILDGKAMPIKEYEGRWFSEESQSKIRKDIYNLYHEENENMVSFFKRFNLQWDICYKKVSFATDMDDRIETL